MEGGVFLFNFSATVVVVYSSHFTVSHSFAAHFISLRLKLSTSENVYENGHLSWFQSRIKPFKFMQSTSNEIRERKYRSELHNCSLKKNDPKGEEDDDDDEGRFFSINRPWFGMFG